MKTKAIYLNHMLAVAMLLLLASVASFAQEGYFGATNNVARAEETSLPVLAAHNDSYPGAGEDYYGALQASETCAQQKVRVGNTPHLILVRGTNMGSAILGSADQHEQNSNCADRRSKSLRGIPSAPQNQVEFGGGGM